MYDLASDYAAELMGKYIEKIKNDDGSYLTCPFCKMQSPYPFQHYQEVNDNGTVEWQCMVGYRIEQMGYVIKWVTRKAE